MRGHNLTHITKDKAISLQFAQGQHAPGYFGDGAPQRTKTHGAMADVVKNNAFPCPPISASLTGASLISVDEVDDNWDTLGTADATIFGAPRLYGLGIRPVYGS